MRLRGSAVSAKWPRGYCILFVAVTVGSIALRLPGLKKRPMHLDEAVHAIKFGELLERNVYRYNPREYHGPTLNYFTLVAAWLSSARRFIDVSEVTLRIVPVFFGVLSVVLLLLLVEGLGWPAIIVAAVLTCVSPAMVFYNRYYVQETLLVCFTFGVIACGYRYTQGKTVKWAILTGVFLGLMHATKETSIIAFGSMLLAILLTLFRWRRQGGSVGRTVEIVRPVHLLAGLVAAAVVSVLFYSSFFSNPAGILDSFRTYVTYFNRAGDSSVHIHPWYYYLQVLIYFKCGSGPVWTEGPIVILAVFGFAVAVTKKSMSSGNSQLLRFIALYTLVMTIVYSAIPYKTPWCMLGFLHGMILLAGVGAVALVKLAPKVLPRLVVICLLAAACVHLLWQAYLANYKYYADSRTPYVYAHTTTDVFAMVQRIEEIAEVHEDGKAMPIHFICPDRHDYWPFPWYLRSFSNVGYWDRVTDNVISAAVIIASPSVEQQLITRLYELQEPGHTNLYVGLFDTYVEIRPQVELRGYITKDLMDRFWRHKSESAEAQGDR
jgi:uncharacterized protein (TIGR03663 family)